MRFIRMLILVEVFWMINSLSPHTPSFAGVCGLLAALCVFIDYLVSVFNVLGLSFKVRGRGMQGMNVRSPEKFGMTDMNEAHNEAIGLLRQALSTALVSVC